jgi:YHS domain-containing protein
MKSLLALLACTVTASAFAGGPTKTPTTIACCVMSNNKVNIATATKKHMYADYKGNRYFFCCAGCPGAFKADPKKYATAAHIKTPKAVKKTS